MSEKIKEYAKAITAFITTAAVLAGAVLAVPGITLLLPATWITVLGIVAAAGVVGGVVAGSPANKIPPDKLKDAVVNEVVEVAKGATSSVQKAIREYMDNASQQFPMPAKTQVTEIGNQLPRVVRDTVDSVVNQVIQEYQSKVK
ncbi:membrane protein [Mycobacterium phage Wildcat]|uniref:Membrane protein n=4 Tax=Mycobacterium virus Wildcat TaxID=1993859 RepID=Q19Y09_9CAUD|nr:holin [Mycobacterium phage Wildcat]AJD82123.1 membrane protein [Mycobacterium phage Cosmo]AQT25723.1 membrane protein [Mycobacterium phage EniyanLRS]QGJ89941.1 membrane protein [Mycobacterium phage MaryV]WKR36061.1 holin [Mycobacterium phage Azrael100]ABE67656.1 membrane protein [Mycobacterium phage Wildcat]